jgi:hypothetical protein
MQYETISFEELCLDAHSVSVWRPGPHALHTLSERLGPSRRSRGRSKGFSLNLILRVPVRINAIPDDLV